MPTDRLLGATIMFVHETIGIMKQLDLWNWHGKKQEQDKFEWTEVIVTLRKGGG